MTSVSVPLYTPLRLLPRPRIFLMKDTMAATTRVTRVNYALSP